MIPFQQESCAAQLNFLLCAICKYYLPYIIKMCSDNVLNKGVMCQCLLIEYKKPNITIRHRDRWNIKCYFWQMYYYVSLIFQCIYTFIERPSLFKSMQFGLIGWSYIAGFTSTCTVCYFPKKANYFSWSIFHKTKNLLYTTKCGLLWVTSYALISRSWLDNSSRF